MVLDTIEKITREEGYQSYMVERYLLMFGETRTLELMSSFSFPPVTSINVNTCNARPSDVARRLEAKGFHVEKIPWCPSGFWLYDGDSFRAGQDLKRQGEFKMSPGATHEYLQGLYSIQGASSMLPPVLLDPRPGEQVLDLAAAPGSKFVQMAQMMDNKGLIVGVDRSKDRMPAIKANVQRSGVINSVLVCNDARELGEQFNGFDKVLIDAPCTGEGLIGSDPNRKNSRSLGDIKTMMRIQVQLLDKAISLARPGGGRIVYSTCSLAPEENENVVNDVLKKRKDCKVVSPSASIAGMFDRGFTRVFDHDFNKSLEHSVRVYPLHHPTRPEGFFICIMERT